MRGRNMLYFLPAELFTDGSHLSHCYERGPPVDLRHHIRIRWSLRDYAPQDHPLQEWAQAFLAGPDFPEWQARSLRDNAPPQAAA